MTSGFKSVPALYGDGTEAKIGDLVIGRGYNTGHDVLGVVTRINRQDGMSLEMECFLGIIDNGQQRIFLPLLRHEFGELVNFTRVDVGSHLNPARPVVKTQPA